MKKHHTTIVLLTLFFTGLIVLWWATYVEVPTSQELEANRNLVLPSLAKLATGDIRRLTIESRGEEGETKEAPPVRLAFERRGEAWQMVEPIDAAADSSRLELLVRNLKSLNKLPEAGTINDPGAKFGLEPAGSVIQLYGADAKTPVASLAVGKTFRDQIYVRPGGTPDIEVVEARFLQGIGDQASGWREKSLFSLSTFQVGSVSIEGPGRNLEAERVAGNWRLVRPIRALGDNNKMEGVLGELTSIRVTNGNAGFVADNVSDRAPYGLDRDHAIRIELRPVLSQMKPQAILLGHSVPDHDDQFYAMQADQDDVVVVSGRELQTLGVDPNSVRSARVVEFDPARAGFIRIKTRTLTFDLAQSEQGWTLVQPTHTTADQQLVTTLLTALQNLETSEFLDASKVSSPDLDPPTTVLELWQLKPGERIAKKAPNKPKGDPAVRLNLGRHDVLRKSVYAQTPGDPTVLAVPDKFLEALPENELAFRERSLLKLNLGQVTKLRVERDRQSIVLAPSTVGGPNQWKMESPVEAPADVEAITKALTMLTDLRAQRLITDRATDLRPFGLHAPSMTIAWSSSSKNGPETSQTLKIGVRVPKSESWFAMLADNPLVFVISDAVVLPFRAEFRSRRILAFPPKQIESLTLRWPDRSLQFKHHPTPRGGVQDWDPAPGTKPGALDLSRISALASELGKLSTRTFIQYDGPFPEASGLSSPDLTVEFTLKGDTTKHSLRVGRRFEEGEYYATTEPGDQGLVFALGGSGWADLLRPGSERKTQDLPDNVFAPGPNSTSP